MTQVRDLIPFIKMRLCF